MSNYQAIGGVSRTLRTLLEDRMEIPPLPTGFTTVPVTITTPDEDDDPAAPRINLFLYRVAENASYKNQEIPGHGSPGAYGKPPLTLDLHYLVTAYGSSAAADGDFSDETLAQWLLGSALRVLHDYPVITDQLETSTALPILDTSLLGEFERVKLYLEPMSLEDMTSIWTALTLPYRLSAAYKVSLVQIESRLARRYPRPVGEPPEAGPRIQVITFSPPRIDRMRVRRQEMAPTDSPSNLLVARIGDRLVITGTGYVQADTVVRLGPVETTPASTPPMTPQMLEVEIPDDPELQPGAQPVKLVRQVMMGEPPEPRPGLQSNLAVFMLAPRIAAAALAAGTVTLTGSRLFQENRDCQAIVGDQVVRSEDYSLATPAEIRFPVPALAAGTYAVRVRVNGAESIDQRTITVP